MSVLLPAHLADWQPFVDPEVAPVYAEGEVTFGVISPHGSFRLTLPAGAADYERTRWAIARDLARAELKVRGYALAAPGVAEALERVER